jgi:probable rRNA maturation factor
MIKINVLSEEKSWSKKLKKRQDLFDNICNNFPKKFRFLNKKVYLTLLLSNNKRIKNLNRKFRKKNKHTDILSFPFEQKNRNLKETYLGDIVISFNYMNKPKDLNSKEFKKKKQLKFLFTDFYIYWVMIILKKKIIKKCLIWNKKFIAQLKNC